MTHTRLFRTVGTRSTWLLAAIPAMLLAPSMGWAEQFVLFDVTFTYTKEDADNSKPSKSHYYVKDKLLNADRPKDWTSPVDYRNGTGRNPRPGRCATSRTRGRRTATAAQEQSSTEKRGCTSRTCR